MTVECETVGRRWNGLCVVAAPGPSLTWEVAQLCRRHPTIAVNDAYRLLPFAEVLYACDARWWEHHEGCPYFEGQKWSSHEPRSNDKLAVAEKYGLRLVKGRTAHGFSTDPRFIHYGSNGGFQAVNLALLFGGNPIVTVGFDMRVVNGKSHFFGDHPKGLNRGAVYGRFIPHFEKAAEMLPDGLRIINATPGSALKCFPMMSVEDALAG